MLETLFSCNTTMGRFLDTMFFGSSCAASPAPASASPPQRLQVMMAGLMRAGSSSLKIALDRLGYSACHGSDFFNFPSMTRPFMVRNARGFVEATEALGFNATLEAHAILWEDLFRVRPDAKVLLLTRDFESWYDSVVRIQDAVYAFAHPPLRYLLSNLHEITRQGYAYLLDDPIDGDCAYSLTCAIGSPAQRAVFRTYYDALHRRVREVVPPEQLLILDVTNGDGYDKLCPFLGIPAGDCPREAFPKGNSRSEVDAMRIAFRVLLVACYVVPLGALLLLWYCCVRSRRQQSQKSSAKTKPE